MLCPWTCRLEGFLSAWYKVVRRGWSRRAISQSQMQMQLITFLGQMPFLVLKDADLSISPIDVAGDLHFGRENECPTSIFPVSLMLH